MSVAVRVRPHRLLPAASIRVEERIRGVVEETLPALIESISEIGLLYPILVTDDGTLVDGGQRLEALSRMGVTSIPVIIDDSAGADTPNEVLAARLHRELASNGVRTQYSPVQAAAARRRLRELHAGGTFTHTGLPLAERRKGWASELASAETGVSRTTMDRVDKIVRIAEDEHQPLAVRREAAEGLTRIDRDGLAVDRVLKDVSTAADAAHAIERYPDLQVLPTAVAQVNMAAHLDSIAPEHREAQIESLRALWAQSAQVLADYQLLRDTPARIDESLAALDGAVQALQRMRASQNLTDDLRQSWAAVHSNLNRMTRNLSTVLQGAR